MRTFRIGCWLALALLPLACGSGNARVYPARGEVFYKGKPAAGAMVHLHPQDKTKCPPAFATVESDGSFQLTTYGKNDGAAAGSFGVTIVWRDEREKDGETIVGPDKLGNRYSKVEKSGLTAVIEAKKNDLPRFELK
jgi:hypothetical protein